MQLVSTFAIVYLKDVLAPLESVCYLGPHAWYIKEKRDKASKTKKQDKKEERKTIRTTTDTVCKGSIQQIIK